MHRCSTIEFTVEQTNGPVQAQVQGSTVYICEASSQSKWWHTHYLHPQIFFSIFVNPPSKLPCQTSLVAQWIRIHLPVQGTWVGPLVQEDLTCHGATKPVRHNYWTCALEPMRCSYWSLQAESLCSATREARALQLQSSPWAAMKTRCNHKFKK